MFDPWGEDATMWSASDFAYLKAFGGREMMDFCYGQEDGKPAWHKKRKCILVGIRGLGKSFLLAHRSYQHRAQARRDTYFHPHGGNPERLVEVLTSVSGAIEDRHWLRNKEAADAWSALWQVAILGMLTWRLVHDRSSVKGFSEVFANIEALDVASTAEDAGSHLASPPLQWFLGSIIKGAPLDREDCQKRLGKWLFYANQEWAAAISRALAPTNYQRVVIYLDNPDELVPLEETDVWTNVQQGLVLAIWKLRKGGGPLVDILHIFASVRSEAVSQRVHADLQHALGLAIFLHYDRDMLKEIFRSLCELTDTDYLANPGLITSDPVRAFLGITEITHQDRHSTTGVPRQEAVLDALIRHTRRVPREIVAIGRKINELPVSERTERAIRSAANSAAEQVVRYIKQNCFPPWSHETETMLQGFDCQVISRDELFRCETCGPESLERKKADREKAVRQLISLGLLGYAEPRSDRHRHFYEQRFSVDESHGRSISYALQRDFFFLHPALKEWVRAIRDGSRQWRSVPVLVGDGLPYQSSPPLLGLMLSSGQPTVYVNGNTPLRPTTNGGRATSPTRFLFLALCAWKLRGGTVWPTIADLNALRSQLLKAFPHLSLPHIGADQSRPGSPVRNWARKINNEPELKRLTGDQYAGVERRHPNSEGSSQDGDRRRNGFITVSASLGFDARIAFPSLDAKDIDIEERLRQRIHLT